MKNEQRKSAQTAATVLSANAKKYLCDYYTTEAAERQADFEVLDGGCHGVRLRMVGIGYAMLLAAGAMVDGGALPLWCAALVCVIGAGLMLGGVAKC